MENIQVKHKNTENNCRCQQINIKHTFDVLVCFLKMTRNKLHLIFHCDTTVKKKLTQRAKLKLTCKKWTIMYRKVNNKTQVLHTNKPEKTLFQKCTFECNEMKN